MMSHDNTSGGSPIPVSSLQYCPANFQIISQKYNHMLQVTSHITQINVAQHAAIP
jgi:hypothetical protein